MLLARGLRRRHPLQTRCIRRRAIADAYSRRLRVDPDMQCRTERRMALAEVESRCFCCARRVDGFHGGDVEIARIEHELSRRRVSPFERKLGHAIDAAS